MFEQRLFLPRLLQSATFRQSLHQAWITMRQSKLGAPNNVMGASCTISEKLCWNYMTSTRPLRMILIFQVYSTGNRPFRMDCFGVYQWKVSVRQKNFQWGRWYQVSFCAIVQRVLPRTTPDSQTMEEKDESGGRKRVYERVEILLCRYVSKSKRNIGYSLQKRICLCKPFTTSNRTSEDSLSYNVSSKSKLCLWYFTFLCSFLSLPMLSWSSIIRLTRLYLAMPHSYSHSGRNLRPFTPHEFLANSMFSRKDKTGNSSTSAWKKYWMLPSVTRQTAAAKKN